MMKQLYLVCTTLFFTFFAFGTTAQAGEWANPTAVSNWSGKGEGNNQCEYKAGDGSVHGVANTIDNNADTSWNAHPCRKNAWFLVYDLGSEKDITAVQMRSAGNGAHDPRKFQLFSCSDANGSSCTKIKDCTRDIEDQKITDANKSYKSCTFTAKSRYFKLSMNGWGKRGSTWYEGSGANWQYNIQDVQFQIKAEDILVEFPSCKPNCVESGGHQKKGFTYKIADTCYLAKTGCLGCLEGGPAGYPEHLEPVTCPAPKESCYSQFFVGVRDNQWSEVNWTTPLSGSFYVSMAEATSAFGAWGSGNRLKMQIKVNGAWKDAAGHTASGTAYRANQAPVSDTLTTTESITGIRLSTPTWGAKPEASGAISVCNGQSATKGKQKALLTLGKKLCPGGHCPNTYVGCTSKKFSRVKDNQWSEVTWALPRAGAFAVGLFETTDTFGAWGSGGRMKMQVQVDGAWQDASGHTASGTPYRGYPKAVTDILSTNKWITGVRLNTPTWGAKSNAAGAISVCKYQGSVNGKEVALGALANTVCPGGVCPNGRTRVDGGPSPYRYSKYWSGAQGGSCGSGYDCASIVNGKGVCRGGTCYDGLKGASCGNASDCQKLVGGFSVCRNGTCQDGSFGQSCGSDSDCDGRQCFKGTCRCERRSDGGWQPWRDNICQTGNFGSSCGSDGDCNGRQCVDGICRCEKRSDGRFKAWRKDSSGTYSCQEGNHGDLCGVDDDCIKPANGFTECRQQGPEESKTCSTYFQCRWTNGNSADQCNTQTERHTTDQWGFAAGSKRFEGTAYEEDIVQCKNYGCGEGGMSNASSGVCDTHRHDAANSAQGWYAFKKQTWNCGFMGSKTKVQCCNKQMQCCKVMGGKLKPQDRCQVSILRYRFGCKGKTLAGGLFQGTSDITYSVFAKDTGCSAKRWKCDEMDAFTELFSKLSGDKCGQEEDAAWYVHPGEVIDLASYEKSAYTCFGEMLMDEIYKRAMSSQGDIDSIPIRKGGDTMKSR